MSKKEKRYIYHDGWFVDTKYNTIYVRGFDESGKRKSFTTKRKTSDIDYVKYIKKHNQKVFYEKLEEFENKKSPKLSFDLKTFGIEVIKMSKRKRCKETEEDYISKFNRYIVKYFSKYELQDITTYNIDKWIEALEDKGLSSTTINRVKRLFNMILKKAVAYDMIEKNPIENSDSIEVSNEKKENYTIKEMNKMIHGATGWFKVYLILAFTSGLRSGELLALKWTDIAFDKNCIFLEHTMRKGELKTSSSTKNHNRIVIVPEATIKALKEHKKSNGCEFVFVTRYKKPFTETKNVIKYHLKPLLKKVQVQYKELNTTRHSYVSIMRNQGVDISLVCDIAGHSKEVSDKHYYTNVVTEQKINAVNNAFYGFENLLNVRVSSE